MCFATALISMDTDLCLALTQDKRLQTADQQIGTDTEKIFETELTIER